MKQQLPKNRSDLEALRAKKISTHYKVRNGFETITKNVDFSKRTVSSIANTYLYFDHDQDVLLPGCAAKTIQDRGPNSTVAGKIKNCKDHKISERIGKPLLIDERTIDGKRVIYAESKMIETTLGNDMLIEYQENVIDQHSIGHRYVDLNFITRDDKEEWSKMMAMLINPDDAEEYGYCFPVKEIELFEWSPVSFGSNELTPYLGVKSGNKEALQLKVYDRLDFLTKSLRSGRQSDETMRDYELEVRQIKQFISELFSKADEPSIKDTLVNNYRGRQNNNDTNKSMRICEGCLHQFEGGNEASVKCPKCGQYTNASSMPVNFDINKAIKETTFSKFFN